MSDLIRREDAIKAMEQRYQDILRIFKRKVKDGEKAIALDMIGCIKSLPSADRPQGKWIDYRPYNLPLFDCSICGYHAKKMSNFCPNCGARMIRQLDAKIVANGNCALCGKPLSDGRLFVCKECQEHIEEGAGNE